MSAASVIAVAAFWQESDGVTSLYGLLVFSLLAGEAVYRLTAAYAICVGIVIAGGAAVLFYSGNLAIPPVFIGLYSLLHVAAFVSFRQIWHAEQEATLRNEALLSEYRKMKRLIVLSEQAARQEERVLIGRDIHDSVGHKLTALLMQLEVFRMGTDDKSAIRVQALKELAKESLEETRNAVKALKHHEAGGLSAILDLIRKLEAESFFRVNFSVKLGALSAPLNTKQSIAVYRAVQECLTNIIRHSRVREADILFEAPGDWL